MTLAYIDKVDAIKRAELIATNFMTFTSIMVALLIFVLAQMFKDQD